MEYRVANAFKAAIFVLGLILITVAMRLFTPVILGAREVFFWSMIYIAYVVFFLPLLFNRLTFKSFASNVPSIVLVWQCMKGLSFLSIVLGVLARFMIISVALGIVIEGALVFVALIMVFLGLNASDHIKLQESASERLLGTLDSIKGEAKSLAILGARLKDDLGEQKKSIARLCEDSRYLSPVASGEAREAEQSILNGLLQLSQDIKNMDGGADSGQLKKDIESLELVMARRRSMTN